MRDKEFYISLKVGESYLFGEVKASSKERAMEKVNAFKDNFNLAAKTFDIAFNADADTEEFLTNKMTIDNICIGYDAIARSDNGYDEGITEEFNILWNDCDEAQTLMKKAIKILIERDMEEIASETENMNGSETYDEATKVLGCEDNLIDFYINRIADDNDRCFVIDYARPYNHYVKKSEKMLAD